MVAVTAKTFLDLCKLTAREAGIPGTGPAAVTAQVGQSALIVEWVSQAWIDIQNRHQSDWRWMRRDFTVDTAPSDGIYAFGDVTDVTDAAPISRFKRWRFMDEQSPAKIYLQSGGVGGETYLSYIPWNYFKQMYRIGTQVEGFPAHISVDPNNNLVLGPVPNDIYTVTGDYVMGAQLLDADATEPDMPADFHKLIVWYALEEYGYRYVAEEAIIHATRNAMRTMRQLEADQLTPISMAGPMA